VAASLHGLALVTRGNARELDVLLAGAPRDVLLGHPELAAWVSLEPSEDDVRALWTAIATAIAPVIGERAAADLRHVAADGAVETVPGRPTPERGGAVGPAAV
jgi:hypothetical protein